MCGRGQQHEIIIVDIVISREHMLHAFVLGFADRKPIRLAMKTGRSLFTLALSVYGERVTLAYHVPSHKGGSEHCSVFCCASIRPSVPCAVA